MAVEASIRENAPRSAEDEGGRVKKFINGIINEINNAARAMTVRELSVDKEKAKEAIASFTAAHSSSDLRLADNTDEFRKYINSKLFKKDKDGLARLSFALRFALDERNQQYQCPEESLEVVSEILFDDHKKLGKLYSDYQANYHSLHKTWPSDLEGMRGVCGIFAAALLPIQVTGIYTLVSYLLYKQGAKDAFKNMSPDEINAVLAFYLTLIGEMRGQNEATKRQMVDELLGKVDNIRADAEYKWFVEGDNAPECKKKIELCDLTIVRLGKILGI
jgi:hypothetical protein